MLFFFALYVVLKFGNHCRKTLDTKHKWIQKNKQKTTKTKSLNDRFSTAYLKHKCLGTTFSKGGP